MSEVSNTLSPQCPRLWILACALTACNPKPASPLERAEFGVMFGGQCQERTEIPFELDATKQALGFVLHMREPSTSSVPVQWELSKPGPHANGLSNPLSRRTELFDGVWPAGQREFRQPVTLNPGDQLGTWNIRVVVGADVAIDRPFWVFNRDSRPAQAQTDAGSF